MLKIEDIINNKQLIELFGSKINKETFNKTNKVNNTLKKTLLRRAYKNYDIEDLGCGKYYIKNYHIIDRIIDKPNKRNYEHPQYDVDVEYDKNKGVYSIVLEDKIYIGSTINSFRNRFLSYNKPRKNTWTGLKLFNKGGIFKIEWIAPDSSDELEIRLKEIEYIDYYNLHTDYIVVNKADNVFILKDKNKLINYNKILIRDCDYEKVLDLLKKEKILYK
jgi:hypothetical protein